MSNDHIKEQLIVTLEKINNDFNNSILHYQYQKFIKKFYREWYDSILKHTSFLDKYKNTSFRERIYCLLNNLSERPVCRHCKTKSVRSFNDQKNTYSKWCSPKCQVSDKECITKSKHTRLTKYGNENYSGTDKSRITRLRKNNG